MKYIIFNFDENEIPIMFSGYLVHSDVARLIRRPVISAGFVSIDEDLTLTDYGESVSLGVKSRLEDSRILTNAKQRY